MPWLSWVALCSSADGGRDRVRYDFGPAYKGFRWPLPQLWLWRISMIAMCPIVLIAKRPKPTVKAASWWRAFSGPRGDCGRCDHGGHCGAGSVGDN